MANEGKTCSVNLDSTDIDFGLNKLFFHNRIAYEWLSTKEAAHVLSITENALRIMVCRGQIPVFRFGSRLRFRLKDCQALFKTKGA